MNHETLDSHLVPNSKPKHNFSYIPFIFWIFIFATGSLFKIMHWPFAGLLLLISYAGILSHSLVGLILFRIKKAPLLFFLCFGIYYFFVIIYGAFIKEGIPYTIYGASIYIGILFLFLLLQYLVVRHKRGF